jgi:uronate dehydrogenase
MVEAGLTAPDPGFAVGYGISANTHAWWDLGAGRALGYHPQDDAETYRDALPERAEDAVENGHVGGPFVTEEFYRPAVSGPGVH